jgi:hypothetical protein
MPPRAEAGLEGHGPYCVSPPLGEAIRVTGQAGESYELSLNLTACTPLCAACPRTRSCSGVHLRLMVETGPGLVVPCLLDHGEARRLIAGLHLGAKLVDTSRNWSELDH